ncbi:DegT/DnrJ/EryC1/StrS family aminotransferase [Escherichia coli]|jgi:dTDP-4-amino-4,6-dideoxygalactose transaminase|uniref:Putative pyridoxamine 5-phosphate-dependent dehydrase n=2 Tax=Escherichia coli TaxID=562 RepID=B1B4Q3_ECOLX|nr:MULTISPECIES: DegT/DnrJ/EryC1/StrS family aminotransferase [Enterobacteriaceae]EIH0604260.1 DegT/DnrJ/EryC1/StrS family aminotransferase [Escherichia coli O55]BAG11892.1 putative pyridoxamine 5-phosphate-dependent dehydrase [Escherichia coli O55:H7]EEC9111097.1 DegT/DnrJ/EryC1/StrS family aminotransferase [Escherichia coli]EED0924926.1 DegT/DnrJ/EryC1/StrS family aminotransferase [Escherichia coli]EED1913787.1 DegT/DnrJ/EryC1/StrS family aminotransferase [Escherichia coli]
MINYPLASSTWDDLEYKAIQSVLDSKMFTMGEYVKQYETQFAKTFGSKYAVMVSSGSTANLLMIAALFFTKKPRLKKGDEIIVPAVSWSTTYYPLQQYGLRVKFVDIDINTLNIDIESLKEAVTDSTKAILTVNLLGNPNNFDEINKIIGGRDIILLEDNCESMGATFNNKCAGTFGLMGTFSSFYSHHIATMEGGCIVTDDEEIYHILLCIRAHGWTRNLPKKNKVTGVKSDDQFEESFKFVLPGYNVRPLEMSGAIGIEQLKKLPRFISVRRKNAEYFLDKFKDHPYLDVQQETGESSWFGFSFIIKKDSGVIRKQLVENLNSAGIECRPIVTGNFLKNTDVLKYFDYTVHNNVDNAEYLDKNGLFVGNHQIELFDQIDYLREVLK